MNSPADKDYVHAIVNSLESRMDARLAIIEAAILEMKASIAELKVSMAEMRVSMADMKASISGLKTTVIVTGISAVIGIVLGVAAFNATVLSNMLASFESGKNTAAAQAEVKRQTAELDVQIKKIQEYLEAARSKDSDKR